MESSPFRFTGKGRLSIAGEQWGHRTAAPVILLHGGGQNRHAWKGSAAALAGAGYYVIAYDARGHGDSEWSDAGEYDMEDNAGDLTALLALLGRPAAVVGASMGGMSALWAQGAAATQLYSAVVLVDVTPRMELSGVTRIVGAGESVYVPRGIVHSYVNESGAEARMIAVYTPSGMEGWFRGVCTPVTDPDAPPPPVTPELLERMLEAGPRFNVRWAL